jgi:acetoin:2,6-dichlorophenolindophenol oxidoreductase subunit alpha
MSNSPNLPKAKKGQAPVLSVATGGAQRAPDVSEIELGDLANSTALHMLEQMYLLRAFDERVSELCRRKQLPGLIHLGVGEEAVAVGVCAALKPGDNVTSTHRAHGHFLAKGGDPNAFMAELYGKETGCCRGKGGSMHLTDLDVGFLGANGVVGAGLPIAIGSALAQQITETDLVTICFFGDGANNQGTFHESLNLAAVWNLPVVFVCENNEYGISINIRDQQKLEHVADRAAAYSMPSCIVDGNNVVAVYRAVSAAVNDARAGRGPTLIECKTYRTTGHYEGDSQSYRPKEEIETWRHKDPIARMEAALLKAKVLSSTQLSVMQSKIKARCDEAQAFAERSSFPPDDAALEDIFADCKTVPQ